MNPSIPTLDELNKALRYPALIFETPKDVALNDFITLNFKISILLRWETLIRRHLSSGNFLVFDGISLKQVHDALIAMFAKHDGPDALDAS
jgi:hypothetical protein